MSKLSNWIWCEKFRSKSVSDLLLPKRIKDTFQQFINQKEIPHFLFYGTAGIGKTTSAKAIINDLDARELYINASNETGIDVIRGKVMDFVSSKGINNTKKIVVLDESDALNINAQQSLKIILEEFSNNSRFFLITNNYGKIIDPLKSRCTEINFNFESKEENDEIKEIYFKRVMQILKDEKIDLTNNQVKKLVGKIVLDCFPDLRKIVGTIQLLVNETKGDLSTAKFSSNDEKIDEIVKLLFQKDILAIRKYMLDNFQQYELQSIFRLLYKKLCERIEDKLLICQAIIIIVKHLNQDAVVADKELNIMSLMSEIVMEVIDKI